MKRIALSFLAAMPLAVAAETAYVTDQLRLGLHRAEDTSDRAFRTLQSGQELEVISQNRNYAQVRLPDGTVGYVKAAYLVTEKPAALIVDETRAENARLQQELDAKIAQFAGPAATISDLERRVAEQAAALDDRNKRVADLEEQSERHASRQEQYRHSLPLKWVAGAATLCLLGGFLGGLWWTDRSSRKRHGGFRLS